MVVKIFNMNYSMLLDFYELTMANGYFEADMASDIAYFDVFFREAPDGAGYAIMAGLQQFANYVVNLKFNAEDLEFLGSKNVFSDKFLNYLANFKFDCDVWAVEEGTVIFPHEPIVVIRGSLAQAQLLETMLLLTINHQSLIATKANRISLAAQGRSVVEYGSRRAHGCYGAICGARAAYIGGVDGTSCTLAEQVFGVPSCGTMSHSWVQSFASEYLAFATYAKLYPHNCVLLVDTYSVLGSGMPNAIRVFDDVLKPMGISKCGVRVDSGDIAYLSKKIRGILDQAGYPNAEIIASNSLDEYIIRDILEQGAKIDSFGVGERLITSKSSPVFDGVYKLVAIEKNGQIVPKIKLSESVAKITNPHFKKVYRLFSKETNMMLGDVVAVFDETIDETKSYELFHPQYTWKRKKETNFYVEEILKPIFKAGQLVYKFPTLNEIRRCRERSLNAVWDEVKRFENPQQYYVDLSMKLWDIKNKLLSKAW